MLRNDRDFVLAAVKQNGMALKYASANFQADRDFVLAAVKQDGTALVYASAMLRNDRDFVLAAVKQNGMALKYASANFQADRDFVLAAVKQNGQVLRWASANFQADRNVVLAAVKQNGTALVWASTGLRADPEVVLVAVKQDGTALKYASQMLQVDLDVMLTAMTAENMPRFDLIPTLHEPLSHRIIDALESASNALDAFEASTGTEEAAAAKAAAVAECDHVREIEKTVDKAILRLSNDDETYTIDKKQEYLEILNGLNDYLGDYDNNPCVHLHLKKHSLNKRQRIEAALAAGVLARVQITNRTNDPDLQGLSTIR